MYRISALFLIVLLFPFIGVLWIIVKLDSKGPFFFKQLRSGKNKKPFTLYKIRTMVQGAEKKQKALAGRNEADGPVFKIRNDPRYTRVGRFLSHTGLDEIPQLINIIKGEMSFVGPRPLPVNEAQKVPSRYEARFLVLPGMTSDWIVKGAHKLSFKEWMSLDVGYARNPSVLRDLRIFIQTVLSVLKMILR